MTRLSRSVVAAGLAGIVGTAGATGLPERDPEATRAAMRRIFESIRLLLPLSVTDPDFRDPARQPQIRAALEELAKNASLLGVHAEDSDPDFRFLGDSLERDARQTLRMYDDGRYQSAEFYLLQLTEYCIACHTKLPSPGDSPLAQHFVDKTALSRLPPVEKARLEMATRRFDEALATFEALLSSPSVHPAELLGPLADYLTVSVRVKGDLERPVPVLRKLARRPDLWTALRSDVERWVETLQEIGGEALASDLDSARRLIEKAYGEIRFPTDRRALVYWVAASSVLHRYVEVRARTPDPALGEAYYLLGLTESRIGRNYWVSQAPFYLEMAIRAAPAEAAARSAFSLLEEETILGYTGSGGTHLPDDVRERLEELRRLVESE